MTDLAGQDKAEYDALDDRIRFLEVDIAASDGELSVIFRTVRSLKDRLVAGENRAYTVEIQARQALDKMYDL